MGLVGNCADVLPELVRRGIVPDVLTDQTSAHDPLNGYVPNGMTLEEARALRARDPRRILRRVASPRWASHVEAMLALQRAGAVTFDYGNNIRTQAKLGRRGATPSTFRASCPSTSGRCSAKGAGRSAGWRSRAIRKTSTAPTAWRSNCFPQNETLARWIPLARQRIHFQGLPARICWLGYGERAEFGVAMNRLVRRGEIAGAHRDRPRPPGRGLGGFALPRNRGHARRLATPSPIGRC